MSGTVLDTAALYDQVALLFPDNNEEMISPSDARKMYNDLIASFVNKITNADLSGLSEYNPSYPYKAGMSALKNGKLYQANEDVTGTWNLSKWTLVCPLPLNWGSIIGVLDDQTDLAEYITDLVSSYVSTAIDGLLDGVPEELNTLNKIAISLNNDDDFAGTMVSALAGKEDLSNKNQPNGYAGLDGSGKVSSDQLPSYVDDVLEYANLAALPVTGETGKIYVTLDTNWQYRWSGSVYIRIVASPGTTDELAEGTTNKYFTDERAEALIEQIVDEAPEELNTLNKIAEALEIISSSVGNQLRSAQRKLQSNVTLEDGECAVLVDYIDLNGHDLTLNGDAVIKIINS